MPFIPENELERALVRAVQDREAAPDFYRLLLESNLLVLGSAEGQEAASEKFTLAPGGRLNLVTGQKNGSQFLPVFSSLVRMQDYVKQDSKYLSVNGRALLDVTRGAPVTLNPASEYGKELSPIEVQQLLDGAPPSKLRTIIGQADYHIALVEALTALFTTRPDINTAWMIQVTFADRAKEPHPLVGIETNSDWLPLMQAIEAAAEKSVPGLVFDVQRVDRQNPAGLTGALLQAAPFYQRRTIDPTLN
ncbi:MAG TPA: enhanced serine sensitivity protein SseB C-terminal domain-containing protein [Rhizomicrobium sp.]|nr:enhanced serine sensitivity protein SseB C-terminal domain-containing protein [Rhizomicrobium sp.]